MKLDVDGRFDLKAAPPGYRLTVDGRSTVYCRRPSDALAYVCETLMSSVDGDVSASLSAVEKKLSYAHRILDSVENVKTVARALARAEKTGGDRRSRVIAVALEISGCPNVDVLKNSNQAKEFSEIAKAIVDAWRDAGREKDSDGRTEEALVGSSPEELGPSV